MDKQLLVSVNIRTYNSAKTLAHTLNSVKNQSYPNIEIVISDGHSKDNSVKLAEEFEAKVDYSDNLGDARHQNYLNSKGKYIMSLDSDQIMDRNLIKECVSRCETGRYDALIISEISDVKSSSYLENVIAFDKWLIDQDRNLDAMFGTVCPRFFLKQLLDKVKWPEGLGIFDDTILYGQLLEQGARVDYISSQSIRHTEVSSWVVLAKKFFRYGKSYFNTLQQNPTTIAAHSLPRKAYFTKHILQKPRYIPGLILLYLVKSTAALAGMCVSLINNYAKK